MFRKAESRINERMQNRISDDELDGVAGGNSLTKSGIFAGAETFIQKSETSTNSSGNIAAFMPGDRVLYEKGPSEAVIVSVDGLEGWFFQEYVYTIKLLEGTKYPGLVGACYESQLKKC